MKQSPNLYAFFKAVLSMGYFSGGYQDSPHEKHIKLLLKAHGFHEVKQHQNLENGKFLYQPNGNNKSPDFLLQNKGKIYYIECKTSKRIKPVYNGGLPNPEYIYIFSSEKYNATTVYYGKDILSDTTREKYKELIGKLNEVLNKYKKSFKENDELMRGFSFYIRNMYIQSGKSQQTDYFQHADRKKCEQNVLNSVR